MAGRGAMMGDRGGLSWPDTLQQVTVTGTALVEQGQVHALYALDTNGDGTAEFRLGFGPWWYEPASGAVLPRHGESVTIRGGLYPVSGAPGLLLVFDLNGLQWRAPEELLPWSGGWMHSATDTTYFQAPMDSLSWMGFPSAAMGELMARMMGTMGRELVPDSAYVHFEALSPERMPGAEDAGMVAGYHVGLSDPWGNDLMGDAMAMGFSRPIAMHLHYDVGRLPAPGSAGPELVLKALAADGTWAEVADATVDPVTGTVSLNTTSVSAYYALFSVAPQTTAVEASSWGAIKTGIPR